MIEFLEGFDHYKKADALIKYSDSTISNISPDYAIGKGMGANFLGSYILKTIASDSIFVFGCYYRFSFVSSTSEFIWSLRESGTEHCSVRMNTSRYLTFTRNGSVLATSTNTLSINTWYHIEAKVKIHDSAGTYEVRVDGTPTGWLSGSGVDSRNGGTGVANQFYMGCGGYTSAYVDDLYLLNSTPPLNDFIGPSKIFTIYPTEAGSYSQFTPSYLSDNLNNVNEPVLDGDQSFNYSSGSAIDTFKFSPATSGSILGIQINTTARQDTGSSRSLVPQLLSSGSLISGSSTTLGVAYKDIQTKFETDPLGNNWTQATIESTEFGYKLET